MIEKTRGPSTPLKNRASSSDEKKLPKVESKEEKKTSPVKNNAPTDYEISHTDSSLSLSLSFLRTRPLKTPWSPKLAAIFIKKVFQQKLNTPYVWCMKKRHRLKNSPDDGLLAEFNNLVSNHQARVRAYVFYKLLSFFTPSSSSCLFFFFSRPRSLLTARF